MRSKSSGKPKKEQVMGWLWGVFPSVLEGVRLEGVFLSLGDLTWRFYNQRFESIRPLVEFVDPDQEPNFRQLLRYFDKLASEIQEHDSLVKQMEKSANEAQGNLVANPAFVKLAEQIAADHPSWSGAYPAEDTPSLLAENAINWPSRDPPYNNTTRDIWPMIKGQVLFFREHETTRSAFKRLDEDRGKLRDKVGAIARYAGDLRDDLADKNGLPPVRPVGAGTL